MVANAGIGIGGTFLESMLGILFPTLVVYKFVYPSCPATVEILDSIYAINIRGTFLCYKHAALQMIKQGRGGRIIGTHIAD